MQRVVARALLCNGRDAGPGGDREALAADRVNNKLCDVRRPAKGRLFLDFVGAFLGAHVFHPCFGGVPS